MKFLKIIKNYKNRTALIDYKGNNISYNTLIKEIKPLSKIFQDRSLIFLTAENDYSSILFYLSALDSNSVIFLLDRKVNRQHISDLIKNYKPNYLILNNNYNEFKNYKKIRSIEKYNLFIQSNFKKIKIYKDIIVLLSTSGTTGTKKLIKLTNTNFLNNTRSIIKGLNIKNDHTVITTLPLSYSFGLSIINTHLFTGATIILNEFSILQREFWEIFKKCKPTSIYGVPYTFDMILKIGLNKFLGNKIKLVAHAGGRLNEQAFKKIADFCNINKIKFFSMYGQTEATARMSILNYRYSLSKTCSIGKPIYGGKFFLKEKNKLIKNPNTLGELYYKGKNVSLGYAQSYLDLKKKNNLENIINTGDIGYFDKNKFYFIVGRKNRFIKLFGHRINLDDIEKKIENQYFKIICEINDDKLIINHTKKYIDDISLKKYIFQQFKINPGFVEFKQVSNFKRTTSGKYIFEYGKKV